MTLQDQTANRTIRTTLRGSSLRMLQYFFAITAVLRGDYCSTSVRILQYFGESTAPGQPSLGVLRRFVMKK